MQYLALFLLPFLAVHGVLWLLWLCVVWVVDWLIALHDRRRARIERELDRKQAEVRATILTLAEQLDTAGLEARKALIRESYLVARGPRS